MTDSPLPVALENVKQAPSKKKGILFSRTWFSSSQVNRKSVQWQVEGSAPERTGAWKAPKRKDKPKNNKSFKKGECASQAWKELEKGFRNQEISLQNNWEGSSDHSSDYAPSKPSRRTSIGTQSARRSLIGYMFSGSKENLIAEDTEDVKVREGQANGLTDKKDFTPAYPSRRKSISCESHCAAPLRAASSNGGADQEIERAKEDPASTATPVGPIVATYGRRRSLLGSLRSNKSDESMRRSFGTSGRRRSLLGSFCSSKSEGSLHIPNATKEQKNGKQGRRRSILGRMFPTSSSDNVAAKMRESIDSTSALSISDASVLLK